MVHGEDGSLPVPISAVLTATSSCDDDGDGVLRGLAVVIEPLGPLSGSLPAPVWAVLIETYL